MQWKKKKGRLLKFTEERNNEVMQYNNQLATLQTRLDRAQSEAVKWESVWTHIKNTAAKKTLMLGRVNMESVWTHIKTTAAKKTLMLGRTKMATHNLFQLVNKHLKAQSGQEIETDNTADQLNKIQLFIMDLTQITTEIKRAEAAMTSAAQTATST